MPADVYYGYPNTKVLQDKQKPNSFLEQAGFIVSGGGVNILKTLMESDSLKIREYSTRALGMISALEGITHQNRKRVLPF